MPPLPWLVALALPVASPEALPAFSPADEGRIVAELCGPVAPGSATRDALLGTLDTVSGHVNPEGFFLYEVLLSQSYREGAAVRHLLVLGGHAVEGGAIRDVQAQNTELNAALAEWRG